MINYNEFEKSEKKWRCVKCRNFETNNSFDGIDHQITIHGLVS